MNTACPDWYALLSPAPSHVVLPGGNKPASQSALTQVRKARVSGLSMVHFLPASSATRPPHACIHEVVMLPSPTFESAKPMPYVFGGFCVAAAIFANSSHVAGGSLKPAALNKSSRRLSTLPDVPNGTP